MDINPTHNFNICQHTENGGSDFDGCVRYEIRRQQIANKFYIEQGYLDLHRWSYDKGLGKEMQDKDIDITVIKRNQDSIFDTTEKPINISEKFRSSDYGDLMVECWSDWEKKIDGSYIKCEADELFVFAENKSKGNTSVYEVTNPKLLKDIAEIVRKQFEWSNEIDSVLGKWNRYNKMGNPDSIVYDGTIYKVTPFISESVRNGRKWIGCDVLIKWDDLESMGVNVKKYEI